MMPMRPGSWSLWGFLEIPGLPPMGKGPRSLTGAPCFLAMLVLAAAPVRAEVLGSRLSELERHGKHIYTVTSSPSGDAITAFLGVSSVTAPGEAMPCVNCHGPDGLGRPESDVKPGNILWSELTKPYRVRLTGGRERPPYTEETLARAITQGIDSGGNRLAPSMPVYTMPEQDLAALIAYLKRLGSELEVGVGEGIIRLGTVLPFRGRFAETGHAMESVLRACLADLNAKGGVYNRRVELEVVDAGESGGSALAAFQQLAGRGDVFAMLAPYLAGADREIAEAANELGIPVVGPYTLYPLGPDHLNRTVFYLLSGVREEGLAFLEFASREPRDIVRSVAFLLQRDGVPTEVVETLVGYARRKGLEPFPVMTYAQSPLNASHFVRELKEVGTLVFHGSVRDLALLAAAAASTGWSPRTFLWGVPVGEEVFALAESLPGGLFLAYSVLPSDQSLTGRHEMNRLAEAHGLSKGPFRAQLAAFCASKILVEALKIAGSQLTRDGLILALERFYQYETGFTPRISYGPNRRIGAWGSYILRVDGAKRDLVPASRWIDLSKP